MSIDGDYLRLVEVVAAALPPAEITGLYLPPLVEDGTYRDEFGFVFLSDHSVGPFYVSLDPILRTLWWRYPRPGEVRGDPIDLARGLEGGDLAERALAIGAFNALSRSLMRRTGFEPPDRGARKEVSATSSAALVGVVGYFGPVIERLVDAGREVLVLERQPARVPERPGVRLTTINYGVTRFRITLWCYEAAYVQGRIARDGLRWVRPSELKNLPLSVTGRRIGKLVENSNAGDPPG